MKKGEPFLVNPHLGILNPKTKRGKNMARRWGKSHMAWVRSFQRGRKRRKSNPWPLAGMVVNPRRKSKRYARNPKRRRSYRRNPPFLGGLIPAMPPMQTLLYTGGGFIAPPFIENAIRPLLPAMLSTGMAGRYIVKGLAVAGTSFAAKFIGGRNAARQAALGGAVYILASVWTDFVAPYFAPQTQIAPATQQAYVSANRQSMRAYVRGTGPTYNTMGIPSAARITGDNSGAVGGTADRFKRF